MFNGDKTYAKLFHYKDAPPIAGSRIMDKELDEASTRLNNAIPAPPPPYANDYLKLSVSATSIDMEDLYTRIR